MYNLLKDYVGENAKDVDTIPTSPYWVLYIAGVPTPLSFSRKKGFKSVSDVASGGVRSRLLIISDCTQLQIQNSKTSHTKSLNAVLKQGKVNYLGSIYPGDWIMAWIVNNKTDLNELLKNIKEDQPANYWNSGLKFVGRVHSIRKNINLSTEGMLDSTYSLDAFAFRELDTELFYDVNLAEKILNEPGLAWLAKLNLDIKNIFEIDKKTRNPSNNGHKIVQSLLRAFMGNGVGNLLNPTGTSVLNPAAGAGAGGVYAYIVPTVVGRLLNRSGSGQVQQPGLNQAEKIVLYTDIMQLYSGVQYYENLDKEDESYFCPKVAKEEGFVKFSGQELLGSYNPIFPSLINKPIWSVLQPFTNPLINEMYTALRVDSNGDIVPQIIFRQIPFTTPVFAEINSARVPQSSLQASKQENSKKIHELQARMLARVPKKSNKKGKKKENAVPAVQQPEEAEIAALRKQDSLANTTLGKIEVTPFHSLPRWELPPILIKNISLGRSDATHVNFVHVYGQDRLQTNLNNIAAQIVQNPPIKDDLDIQRSGVRPFMTTIPSGIQDHVGKSPEVWMQLISDQMMASHLTLNGHVQCVGIHMPICEGDNLQIGDMLFHIESVSHSCNISADGRKHFETNLAVTNGVSLNVDGGDTDPGNTFYLGLTDEDTVGHDAGLTIDTDIGDGDLGEEEGDTFVSVPVDPKNFEDPRNLDV